MNTQNETDGYKRNRPMGGLILVIVGSLLLLHKVMPELMPGWLFTWPMILVAVGLYIGAKRSFQLGGWLVPLVIGVFFLIDQSFFDLTIRQYFWPLFIIGLGLMMILRPRRRNWEDKQAGASSDLSSGDAVDIQTLFGGVKKNMISKNFKGGRIESMFGGTELNLMQADFTGTAVLDFNIAFGGVKLYVPPQWNVKSEVTAILGGVEDKRAITPQTDSTKVLLLRGSVMFGGIEIKCY